MLEIGTVQCDYCGRSVTSPFMVRYPDRVRNICSACLSRKANPGARTPIPLVPYRRGISRKGKVICSACGRQALKTSCRGWFRPDRSWQKKWGVLYYCPTCGERVLEEGKACLSRK